MAARAAATAGGSSAFLPAQTTTPGACGAALPKGIQMSFKRVVSAGDVVVSTRNTTGASSPLAPCTVMTRTSSRLISMSRLTSVSAARSHATKPCSEAGALRS